MKTVVAAALGECVHVAGISNFLQLAEAAGWRTVFIGPAVPIRQVLEVARQEKADLVGVSYRLTPENGERLLGQFAEEAADLHVAGVRFAFGGTPPVAERVKSLGFFERIFDGNESTEQVLAWLKGQPAEDLTGTSFPQTTIERIQWKRPYPILRHHFGLPTMEATLDGIAKIADSQALDLISLGTDQDAQENFFHPERQDPRRKGAGGVPVRTQEDFRKLFLASRRGNYPLMRSYSGTDDFIQYAQVLTETIHNAWCAIPLFWFNQMDGRGPWDLEGSIREHQKVMAWYGERNIPVELNEPHHWGMRDAPDVVFIVSAFLSAYNARKFGVRDYIAQMMFNSPSGLSDSMDLAKMLAILELVTPLSGLAYNIWKQTRTGLLSYPLDPEAARGHLAASVYLQMGLKPDIIHIVGHTEADHAAAADDVIIASKITRRVIENSVRGAPDPGTDPRLQARRDELVAEARITLEAIRLLAAPEVDDPWTDAATLAAAVKTGILDAPQLKNNRFGCGAIRTQVINGMCLAVDPTGRPLSEKDRLAIIRKEFE
ncbi:MAG: methionine synthase [Chloroflexi bacterium GWB2_49_20]|nr:MAG: methionine synthase [Chloroflexi bacterium GWB2_49_20]OGN77159.1 MAG: methionine synthase [Chloroflexi bacterium GWC2_49_37]OGN83885.1 MAG: methionine synthase [Chloroflexi bacterium GWD2_49_16]